MDPVEYPIIPKTLLFPPTVAKSLSIKVFRLVFACSLAAIE
jgi:hypothetical protein